MARDILLHLVKQKEDDADTSLTTPSVLQPIQMQHRGHRRSGSPAGCVRSSRSPTCRETVGVGVVAMGCLIRHFTASSQAFFSITDHEHGQDRRDGVPRVLVAGNEPSASIVCNSPADASHAFIVRLFKLGVGIYFHLPQILVRNNFELFESLLATLTGGSFPRSSVWPMRAVVRVLLSCGPCFSGAAWVQTSVGWRSDTMSLGVVADLPVVVQALSASAVTHSDELIVELSGPTFPNYVITHQVDHVPTAPKITTRAAAASTIANAAARAKRDLAELGPPMGTRKERRHCLVHLVDSLLSELDKGVGDLFISASDSATTNGHLYECDVEFVNRVEAAVNALPALVEHDLIVSDEDSTVEDPAMPVLSLSDMLLRLTHGSLVSARVVGNFSRFIAANPGDDARLPSYDALQKLSSQWADVVATPMSTLLEQYCDSIQKIASRANLASSYLPLLHPHIEERVTAIMEDLRTSAQSAADGLLDTERQPCPQATYAQMLRRLCCVNLLLLAHQKCGAYSTNRDLLTALEELVEAAHVDGGAFRYEELQVLDQGVQLGTRYASAWFPRAPARGLACFVR